MHRLFLLSSVSGDEIEISDKSQAHHIKNVLHLKAGEKVVAVDKKGNEYLCAIKEFSGEKVILRLKEKIVRSQGEGVKVTIACALPKKSKFDDIVERLTQLGVHRIIPMDTERVVVRLDKHKEEARLERWQKIAESAAQQSQRNNLPVIDRVKKLEEVLAEAKDYDLKLVPALIDERVPLKAALTRGKYKNILVLIGPEGDFTSAEVNAAKRAGFIPVTLGKLVLRVETAAVTVASFIMLNENY